MQTHAPAAIRDPVPRAPLVPTAVRPWFMWALPTFLFFLAFFHRPAPGVMARELMDAFGATGAMIGLLAATYFYAYAAFMVPAGVLIDAYGVRLVVSAGGAVMGGGALLMGVASTTAVLFAGRLVVGLGATVTFIGALAIAAAWFPPSRFGTLSAITATTGIFGSLAATAPLAWLVAQVGWRRALVLVGVGTLIGAGLCAWLVRDRPPATEGPAGAGPLLGAVKAPALRDVLAGMRRVVANRHTWPPFLGFFFLYAASGNQTLWLVPYLRDVHGLSTTHAAVYAMAPALALLASGPLTGVLSDRVVRRRKLPYVVLAAGSFVLWTVFVLTLGALPLGGLFTLLFGMGVFGAAFVLTWPIGREVNPPDLAGVSVAVVNLGGFIGAALTQGPLGAVLDAGWAGAVAGGARVYPLAAYRITFAICAAFALLAALASLFVRETRGRNVYADPRARR